MKPDPVSLNDKYALQSGRAYLSGTQALVRLPLMQRARDQLAGLNTGGFISGYRGSPLGGYDRELWRAESLLRENRIHFQPGLNEDLAATSVWGTQQTPLFPGATVEGVFSIWYGKGPGVDRSADVLKHGNAAGTSRHGGVLVVAGDDHGAQSSTLAHQSEQIFAAAMIPVLHPSSVQEYLDFGLYGFELSRYSGCWVGFKAVTETVDSSASVDVDLQRVRLSIPEFALPNDGLSIRFPDSPLEQERRLHGPKMLAINAFARANRIDRIVFSSPQARLGIMATGKAYLDVLQALQRLGMDENTAIALGLRLYKVGMTWPLQAEGALEFAHGLDEILVVEEKRAFIEEQLVRLLYAAGENRRPRVLGKLDEQGRPLIPSEGETSPVIVAQALLSRMDALGTSSPSMRQRLGAVEVRGQAVAQHRAATQRTPFFCSGCPHNTSTRVPEGSQGLAGIGCHGMVQMLPKRNTFTLTHMGGEGATWIGRAPFSAQGHVFQNLGDGTYQHSGLLAIRAAAAAGVNITYKILYNAAVAMTGGQALEGAPGVPQITRQVTAEGAKRVVVVTDDPDRYAAETGLAPGVTVHHRRELDQVQRELRSVPGLTVLVYDQGCAAEKRRKLKHSPPSGPQRRVAIHADVCEGCGDCSRASNCISILPLQTDRGLKRTIDQSGCNKDFSCVEGFCPSFVTLVGARPRRMDPTRELALDPSNELPAPAPLTLGQPYGILIAGVGGSGVMTLGHLIGMAAHLDGLGCSVMDVTGMAQKNGAVTSHVRVARQPSDLAAVRIDEAGADLVLACDPLVASSAASLSRINPGTTRVVINSHLQPTPAFVTDNHIDPSLDAIEAALEAISGPARIDRFRATALAEALVGDAIAANLLMLGYAFQRGLLPVSLASIERAIELNAVSVESNKKVFAWGRLAAHDPAQLWGRLDGSSSETPPATRTLAEVIRERSDELAAYQDPAYASRYRAFVDRVAQKELAVAAGSTVLTEAVAQGLFKLMAYKDEYEVARLYARPDFMQRLRRDFEGDFQIEFHLSIPLLERWLSAGQEPRKRRYGGWMLQAFKVLARLKGLRGTVLDPFAYSEERRFERQLIEQYQAWIEEMLGGLRSDTVSLAARVARLPEDIRGFGHVKRDSALKALSQAEELLAAFRSTPASTSVKAA